MNIKYAAEKENSFNFSQKYFDSKIFNFFCTSNNRENGNSFKV